ncbi:D-serine ammonia-lyase [Virgibacillus xinjiangensis]|uniref:Probable D-serine dehydratase n=1 Tax=Virgibacillus xinjiangensis TaxID=393090 RepID=A0ABV7CQP9_9BACI
MLSKQEMEKYKQKFPELDNIMKKEPILWLNPGQVEVKDLQAPISEKDIHEAERLWQRFAPFIQKAFPETASAEGIIESPLMPIPGVQQSLTQLYNQPFPGSFYLKGDHSLPVAGSIKARGGFFEVLAYAEKLAWKEGKIRADQDYAAFARPEFQEFFSQYKIGVGSTGNLGLSIGIMAATLGFRVSVYMSRDARQWKKDLLRKNGAEVKEFSGDFSVAIAEGREQTLKDPQGYFVDDEDSKELFLGYSTVALRLKEQLEENGVRHDAEHPVFVYLPCGVGGAPGGVTFGLKHIIGDHVHCFFVEPTHSPSVLIGIGTGEGAGRSVQDFGLDNITEADGLAVGRPSRFATEISSQLASGICTVEDDELYRLLAITQDQAGIGLEPSATAGLQAPQRVLQSSYVKGKQIKPENITHISWSTGGGLVPDSEMQEFYKKGKGLLGDR